jgi:hypothetical protein
MVPMLIAIYPLQSRAAAVKRQETAMRWHPRMSKKKAKTGEPKWSSS